MTTDFTWTHNINLQHQVTDTVRKLPLHFCPANQKCRAIHLNKNIFKIREPPVVSYICCQAVSESLTCMRSDFLASMCRAPFATPAAGGYGGATPGGAGPPVGPGASFFAASATELQAAQQTAIAANFPIGK